MAFLSPPALRCRWRLSRSPSAYPPPSPRRSVALSSCAQVSESASQSRARDSVPSGEESDKPVRCNFTLALPIISLRNLSSYCRTHILFAEEVFKRVRTAAKDKTQGKHIPWESSSLMGDFTSLPLLRQLAAAKRPFQWLIQWRLN